MIVEKIQNTTTKATAFLVTGDVSALYTNMNIDRPLAAVRNIFSLQLDPNRPDEEILEMLKICLLNIASCNLHIAHGAFQDGLHATGWDIERFVSCLYWLFKDSPAWREDFSAATGCTTYPLKMCCHQWLENVEVCDRAVLLLPVGGNVWKVQ